MDGSWLSGFTRRRRVGRQGERTQVEGRRAVAPQTMIKNQQLGLAQALAQLAQVLLEDEGLPRTGVGFLFGGKAQVGSLGRRLHFARIGLGLVAGHAGLQLRLVGLLGSRSTFPGNQRLGANLRRLHTVVGIGRASRRMDGLDSAVSYTHLTLPTKRIV